MGYGGLTRDFFIATLGILNDDFPSIRASLKHLLRSAPSCEPRPCGTILGLPDVVA